LAGGTNLYTYVRNNPPNSIDPLGLIDLVDDVLFDPDDPLSVPGPFVGGGGGGGFRGFGSGRFKNIFSSQSNVGKSCSSVSKRGYRVNWGQQEKHFPGHNSYTPGRSTMTNDPSKLSQKAGTGKQIGKKPIGTPGSKERIDFGEKIGTYIDEAGNSSPTTKGILHYGKKGIHIVPARP
jgi:filamentous hemagglutinin